MVLLDLLHVQRAGFFKFLKIGIDKELSQLNINVDNTRLQVIPFLDTPNTHGVMGLTELPQKDRKQKQFIKREMQLLTSSFGTFKRVASFGSLEIKPTKEATHSKESETRQERVALTKYSEVVRFVKPQVRNVETFSNLPEPTFYAIGTKHQVYPNGLPRVSFPSILSYASLSPRFGYGKLCAMLTEPTCPKVYAIGNKSSICNNRAKLPDKSKICTNAKHPKDVRSYPSFSEIATAKIPEGSKEFLQTIPLNQASCFRLIASRYTPREAIIYQKSWSCKLVVKVLLTVHEKKELKKKNTSSYFVPTQNKQAPVTNQRFVRQLKNKIAEKKKIFLTRNLLPKVNKSTDHPLQSTLQSTRPTFYAIGDKPSICKKHQVVHSYAEGRSLRPPADSIEDKIQSPSVRSSLVSSHKLQPKTALRFLNSSSVEFTESFASFGRTKQQKIKQKNQKRDHELFLVLGELPLMTKRGHFIIHGSPRVILSQLIRTPGIYFTQKNNELQADCVPEQGPWLCIYKNINNEDSTNKSTDYVLPSFGVPSNGGSQHNKIMTVKTKERLSDQKETLSDYVKTNIEHNNSKDLSFVDSLLYSNYRNESKNQQQASYFCYTKQFSSMPFSLVYSTFRVFELHSQFTDQTLLLTKLKTLEKIRKFKEVITTLLTFTWKKRVRRRLQRLYTKRCFTSTQQFEKTKLLFRLKKKLILGPLSRKSFNEKLGMSSCISTGINHNAFNKDFFNTNFLNHSRKNKENENEELCAEGLWKTRPKEEILSNLLIENQSILKRRVTPKECKATKDYLWSKQQKGFSILKNYYNKQTNFGSKKHQVVTPYVRSFNSTSSSVNAASLCFGSERKHTTCCFVNNEFMLPRTPKDLGMLSNNNSRHNKQTKKNGLVKSIEGQQAYYVGPCFGTGSKKNDLDLHTTTYPFLSFGSKGRTQNIEGTFGPGNYAIGSYLVLRSDSIEGRSGTKNLTSANYRRATTEDRPVSPWLNPTTLLSRDLALIVSFLDGSKILTEDDIDDLNNQRVRTSSDQIQQQVRIGLFRFKKMFIKLISSGGTSQTITDFLNGALREFFGSNPLSQFLDQTNPLAEITHKRRISKLGLNGIQRESATLKVRTIHSTYFGRICPIETPEGINAGLVNSLTCLSRVDQKGQLVTPLSILIEGQKQEQFFYYSNKEDSPISTTDTALLKFHRLPNQFIYTKNESQFQQLEPNKVKIRVKSDLQTISLATALIPFLAYDDANRALMGSNMQRQAVPLILPERPIIRTGMESLVINESGHSFQSSSGGFISYVSAQYVVILRDTLNKRLLI